MANIVGVKFSGNAKIYSFDSGELELVPGDGVVVETVKGLEFGTVAEAVRPSVAEDEKNPLKPVVRKATDKDYERVRRGLEQKPHTLTVANEKIAAHKLPMKLVDCEYAFDGSKLIFYFTSESRVDFRDLVRDLASYFHMRIELRQIGIRDECKMLGGIAPCGRPCCCAAFLDEFTHVTVKMAKNQGLSLNPTKISGLCGRLMCCLEYENDHYVETGKRMPRIGSEVETPDGVGVVLSDNMLKEEVRVRVPVKDGYEMRDYKLDEIGFEKAAIGCGSQKFVPKEAEAADDSFEFGAEAITAREVVVERIGGDRNPERHAFDRAERPNRPREERRDNRPRSGGGRNGRGSSENGAANAATGGNSRAGERRDERGRGTDRVAGERNGTPSAKPDRAARNGERRDNRNRGNNRDGAGEGGENKPRSENTPRGDAPRRSRNRRRPDRKPGEGTAQRPKTPDGEN